MAPERGVRADCYASQEMDLYLVAERYVQFNYESAQSSDVTVILPGASA